MYEQVGGERKEKKKKGNHIIAFSSFKKIDNRTENKKAKKVLHFMN